MELWSEYRDDIHESHEAAIDLGLMILTYFKYSWTPRDGTEQLVPLKGF